METYPDFFTPRDEEPSLSSSEEKYSEFDWLERKIMRKQKYRGKTEQVLGKIYFLQNCTKDASKSKLSTLYMISRVKEITNYIYEVISPFFLLKDLGIL